MNKVRLAVIGAGQMGRKHAHLVSASAECALVGLCDLDAGRRSVAEDLHVPFYEDAEALLERERPEGAIIATPNALHAPVAELCARHGVHVLIEKPIADTLDEAQQIVGTAEAHGVRVLVGHHRRHNPLIQEARALVRGGALGKLVAVSVLWALYKPSDYHQVGWRRKRPGGGPTLINLIHEFDSLRYICGEIRWVYAQSSSAVRRFEVEDSLSIAFSFQNGALGSILASDATPSPWSYEATTRENPMYYHAEEDCYRFLGSEGSLAFPRMELWRYADRAQMGWQHPMHRTLRPVQRADPLASQLAHFCRVVRGEELPLVDGRDGARTLAVALAVLESARKRRPVEVSPLQPQPAPPTIFI